MAMLQPYSESIDKNLSPGGHSIGLPSAPTQSQVGQRVELLVLSRKGPARRDPDKTRVPPTITTTNLAPPAPATTSKTHKHKPLAPVQHRAHGAFSYSLGTAAVSDGAHFDIRGAAGDEADHKETTVDGTADL
ncbi:hypothetical protein HDU90_004374 [Geranomyces variabilis]|nr:hypothetical protein HDU90_004374 [Geranomyces variabilis]